MQELNLLEKPQEAAETAPVENEAEAPQQEGQERTEPQDSPEDISEATGMGWVPKERFKGDPELWRPAKEFARRGKEILPIVQKREREMRDKLSASERKIAEMEQSFDDRARRMEAMARIALDRQREAMEASYKSAMRRAASEGDLETFDRLEEQKGRALAEFDPEKEIEKAAPAKPKEESQVPTQIVETVQSWIAENPWFDRYDDMAKAAENEHKRLLKRERNLSIEENLQKTLEFVQGEFPDRFKKQAAQQTQPHAPAVEGGGRQSGSAGRARGWEQLPPEAKSSGERFITRDGLFLPKSADAKSPSDADIKAARAAYAKQYWEQDV